MPNHWRILMKDGILQTSEVNYCLPCEVSHTTEGAFSGLGDVLRNGTTSGTGITVAERCTGLLWVKREHPPSATSSRCLTHNSSMGKIRYKPIICVFHFVCET